MKIEETLSVVTFSADPEDAPVLIELLTAVGLDAALLDNRQTGESTFRIYARPDEARDIVIRLNALFREIADLIEGGPPRCHTSSLAREDWSETWKRHFHPFRASKRLVVKPSWEEYHSQPGDVVIQIDPGMSFGTGYHGTTRACLEFIDELSLRLGPVSLLDCGCGSGILSLAAATLGFEPVLAFDHDPDAVEVSVANLASAGISRIVPVCAEVAEYTPATPCRVVVANILASVILEQGEKIVSFADTGHGPAHLILSGILSEQYEHISGRFASLGAREIDSRTLDEWTTGWFALEQKESSHA